MYFWGFGRWDFRRVGRFFSVYIRIFVVFGEEFTGFEEVIRGIVLIVNIDNWYKLSLE